MTRSFFITVFFMAGLSLASGVAVSQERAASAEPVIFYGNPPRPIAMPQTSDGIFRGFIWGVSPADVRKYETAQYYNAETGVLFFIELPSHKDYRRLIRYDFLDQKLWRAQYTLQDLNDADPNVILNLYEDFKRALVKQYGEPIQEGMIWKPSPYRDHPKFWGRALLSKDLQMRTIWEKDGTRVVLENYFIDPDFKLTYRVEQMSVADAPQSMVEIVPQAPVNKTSIPSANQ